MCVLRAPVCVILWFLHWGWRFITWVTVPAGTHKTTEQAFTAFQFIPVSWLTHYLVSFVALLFNFSSVFPPSRPGSFL